MKLIIMNYPKHIAVIPDGNRTWAKQKGYEPFVGHLEGFNKVIELARYIFTKTPIEVFTVWGLSTENLKNRSEKELDYLFELYKKIPNDLFITLKENKVNFRCVGDISKLPDHLANFLEDKKQELSFQSDRYLILAVNYGGQDELLRGIKKLCDNKEKVSKENLEKYLDFGKYPTIDLVIRTKKQFAQRLSGFMLWRIGYTQLYFTDIFFPEFDVEELKKALNWYDKAIQTQNYGS